MTISSRNGKFDTLAAIILIKIFAQHLTEIGQGQKWAENEGNLTNDKTTNHPHIPKG